MYKKHEHNYLIIGIRRVAIGKHDCLSYRLTLEIETFIRDLREFKLLSDKLKHSRSEASRETCLTIVACNCDLKSMMCVHRSLFQAPMYTTRRQKLKERERERERERDASTELLSSRNDISRNYQ
jgi:hypothetical protein